jgi:hypothetical protein
MSRTPGLCPGAADLPPLPSFNTRIALTEFRAVKID